MAMTNSLRRLIHFPANRVYPVGGPAGYLFNLRQGLSEIGIEGYDFLPAVGMQAERDSFLGKVVPSRLKDARRLRNLLALPGKNISPSVDYSGYECIHFHSTEDLYVHREALEDYDGEVFLTSHSPCAYHKELVSRLNPKDAQKYEDELRNLSIIDEYAFRRADTVVFPCREAEEPYFHTWKEYAFVRDESKLRYVPTGIQGCTAKVDRDEVRGLYDIPKDAFVMCYVGRHNSIKGYDVLAEVALSLLDDPNTWMLVAGKEGPIFAPKHERWVEVGWTDDPHSLIAASDVFVLPNRETYFDLVLLEVLSLGTPVIASRTGGNKYFEGLGAQGVFLYENPENLIGIVRAFSSMAESKKESASKANVKLFTSEFTCSCFARRYCSLIDEVCYGGMFGA